MAKLLQILYLVIAIDHCNAYNDKNYDASSKATLQPYQKISESRLSCDCDALQKHYNIRTQDYISSQQQEQC